MHTKPPIIAGSRIGIDTAPFIYLIEQNPAYYARVRAFFQLLDSGTIHGYTSIITLIEVLTIPRNNQPPHLATAYRAILSNSPALTLIPTDIIIAERAAQLRVDFQLRTPDAIQVATALHNRCAAFFTNDKRLRRVSAIPIVILDECTEDDFDI